MNMRFNIGILRETQAKPDSRVALTPNGVRKLLKEHKNMSVVVQPSVHRAFKDEEYIEAGCVLGEDMSDCDLLLGLKEVDKDMLLEGKRYMFFSHTAKKQLHNQPLLQAIIDKHITLLDYEYLYDSGNRRIAAFGYFAGLAGAYNTLRAYGLKYELFELTPLCDISNKSQMWKELKRVVGKRNKILITGNGRVSTGVEEVLEACGILKVDRDGFFNQKYPHFIYYVADPTQYAKHREGIVFTFEDYKSHPEQFVSDFLHLAEVADVFIATHYWDPNSPKLFTLEDTKSEKFNIKVIGDITCDIEGSVPTTIKSCSIEQSYYDFNANKQIIEAAFSSKGNISIMAVDKLPSALPIESSEYFSEQLVNHVLSYFWMGDDTKMLKKATIAKDGKIKKRFAHLRTFVQEKR